MGKVADGIYVIRGQDEFIPDSHTYILGEPLSGDCSLVDPGLMGKAPYKLGVLDDLGFERSSIRRVIMTHTHLDHIGCLPDILTEIPDVELWVHALEAEPLEKGDERTVYGMEMFRNMCQMQYGLKPGQFAFTVHRHLEGGETVECGGAAWEVLHIPGHSVGGIALYNPAARILIPGDVVYADYAIGRFDLHGADPSALNNSLRRLAELDVDVLLPGHNRLVNDLPEGYIRSTATQWEPHLR